MPNRLNEPSVLEQARAQKQAEDRNSMENFQQNGDSLMDYLSFNAKAAVDSNSFGVAALWNKGRRFVEEAKMDTTEDPAFRSQMNVEFLNKTAEGIPQQLRKNFLEDAPNYDVYYKRVEWLRRQLQAKETLATSDAAQNIAIAGKVSEVAATVGMGPGAVGLAARAGQTGLATRVGAAAVGNAAPNAVLDLAQASEDGRSIAPNEMATSVAIDGVVGGVADGLKSVEAVKVAKTIGGPLQWAAQPVKRVANNIISKFKGEAKTAEDVAVPDAVKAPETAPVGSTPMPDLTDALKGQAKAQEGARIAGKDTTESPLGEVLTGTTVGDKVASQGLTPAEAFKTATSTSLLGDTVRAAQRFARSFGEDPLTAAAKQAELEGALEAHLGVNLPKGWLTGQSAETTLAHIARERAAKLASTDAKGAEELNKLADETAAKSKWVDGKRTIDISDAPKVADEEASLVPQAVREQSVVYTVGRHSYAPVFDSAVDKALFVVGRGATKGQLREALSFLKNHFKDLSEEAIKKLAKEAVIPAVREIIENIPPGARAGATEVPSLRIPRIYKENIQKPSTEKLSESIPEEVPETAPLVVSDGTRWHSKMVTKVAVGGAAAVGITALTPTDAEASTGGAAGGGAGAALAAVAGAVVTKGKLARADAKAADKALKEWQTKGYKASGLLRHEVSTPKGGLTLPNSDKVAFSHISLKLPFTEKTLRIPIGWLPADKVGTDEANAVRVAGDLLLVNAVGKKNPNARGSALVNETADVLSRMRAEASMGRVQERATAAFQQWLADKGIKDGIKTDFNVELAQQFNREWADGMRGYPGVSKTIKEAVKDIQKVVKEAHAEIEALALRQGVDEESGSLLAKAANIKVHDEYLMRVHSREARLDWGVKIGQEGIEAVYSAAMKDTMKLTQEEADKLAKDVVKTLDALDESKTFQLAELDYEEIKKSLLDQGIDADKVDNALSLLLPKTSDKAPRQLTARMVLDEKMEPIKVKGVDGQEYMLSIRDFFVNDPSKLMSQWFASMHGIQALGEVGERIGVDLTSKRGWELLKSQMKAEGGDAKAIELLDAARDHILAKGGDEVWQSGSQLGNSLRQLLTMRYGMGFVFAQLSDLGNQLPQGQLNRILDSLPGMADIKASARNGGPQAHGLMRDIANVTGLGLDHITPVLRQMVEVGGAGEGYRNISMALHKAMSANGFYAVMDTIKAMSVNLQLYKLADAAQGTFQIAEKDWKHLAINGIDQKVFDQLKPLLADPKLVSRDASGTITGIDFKGIRKANPEAARKLETMMYKVMKDASSEASGIGQVMPFMTSELGRFITQFQGAAMVAHQRLRRDILNFDGQVAMRWFSSFIFSMTGYTARTALMTFSDPEELEKKLDPHVVLAAALRNSSSSGFIPNVVSLVSAATPWGDPLSGASTTGRVSVNAPPIFDAVSQAGQSLKDMSTAVFTDDELTSKEASKALRSINPLWAVQAPANMLFNTLLPEKNPELPKE